MTKVAVTPGLLARFRAYHEKHLAWGAMHVMLDDDNFGDCFCDEEDVQAALAKGDTEGAELLKLLQQMTRTQRVKVSRKA